MAGTKGNEPSAYRKGNYKLVDHGRGRVTLQEIKEDDAAPGKHDVELDISGLSLAGESGPAQHNPYDSVPQDGAAKIWKPQFSR